MSAMHRVTPFSNGTEGEAWMAAWCHHCAHDHSDHGSLAGGSYCELILNSMLGKDARPHQEWIAEPDDGQFHLPSRMICLQFTPCHTDGCDGDPGAEARAQRVAEVTAYWQDRTATPSEVAS